MSNCGGCASARDRCGNGLEKIYPTTAIRYGRMNYIGEFSHDPNMAFACGGKVIIQTDRGIEVGQQVSLTCHGCDKSVTRDQMRAYAKASGNDSYRLNNGRILREATESDLAELRHLEQGIFDKLQTCRRLSAELNLPMKIVDAEHVFGGERIIFYFMSEDRIDFRELVRLLAREFQTRIEMRQVGARDEARLLADYETCGRECCCKNFLKVLKPIGMQMAKLQKATLDPSKVSGRCGRLKCCLRYEHETYADLDKKLPRTGRRVRTATEEGVVIDRQVLTQLLKIRKDDGTVATICEEDITERDLREPPAPPSGAEDYDRPGRGPSDPLHATGREASKGDRRRQDGRDPEGRGARRDQPGDRRGPDPRRPLPPQPEPEQDEVFGSDEVLDDEMPIDDTAASPTDEAADQPLTAGLDDSTLPTDRPAAGSDVPPGAVAGELPAMPGDTGPQAPQGRRHGRRRSRNRRRRRGGGNRPPGSPPPAPR
ncbi:MAG: hypothetical protein HY718_19680 [Planctomycetes bacterium]|nr:hypothetical protein [Planctomycetota bacterium]